jgi:hypothetical protein
VKFDGRRRLGILCNPSFSPPPSTISPIPSTFPGSLLWNSSTCCEPAVPKAGMTHHSFLLSSEHFIHPRQSAPLPCIIIINMLQYRKGKALGGRVCRVRWWPSIPLPAANQESSVDDGRHGIDCSYKRTFFLRTKTCWFGIPQKFHKSFFHNRSIDYSLPVSSKAIY